MATTSTPSLALEAYLHTAYSPDRDYVDGEVEERNLGEFDHADIQTAIASWFRQHGKAWNLRAIVELRVRVSSTRVRVPDVCLIARDSPREQVITHPPLAVLEVLSPEDRISRYQQRLTDYQNMGIPNIWVINPETRKGYDCSTGSWIERESFQIEGTQIRLSLPDLFAAWED
ncbi:MAG: Uma2 family endonuclease [Acidobacteriaceae bacterium]